MALPHRITTDQLDRMKSANLPQADASAFGALPDGTVHKDGDSDPTAAAYPFLPPQDECPNCGSRDVDWGIVHGQAHCMNCGYPCRVYHYFREPGKDSDTRVVQVLWYHPSGLEVKE